MKGNLKHAQIETYASMVKYAIGKEYTHGTFANEENEFVREAYAAISKTSAALFKEIPFKVTFTEYDPYESAKHMRDEVRKTGEVFIYTGWSGHPFLTHEQNNVGRAVHDVFAHLVCGCPFNFEGEYSAYLEQRKYYPEWTWKVLFAEIPAQTSAYYYNKGFTYRQRAIEAPQAWLDICEPIQMDYSHNSVLPSLLTK